MTRIHIYSLILVMCLAAGGIRAQMTAESLMEAMGERLATIEQLHAESSMRITFEEQDESDDFEQQSSLVFRRPDHVLMQSESIVLLSDGAKITAAFPHFEYAMQRPIEGSLQEVLSDEDEMFGSMLFPDVAALLSPDPVATLRSLTEEFDVTVLPDEEYEGRPAWVVRIDVDDMGLQLVDGVRVWIDQETGLVAGLRAAVDLSAEAGFPHMDDMPKGYDITYQVRVVTLNEPLDEDAFAYDLSDFTIVNSMEELMEAFQGGSGAARSQTIAVGSEAPEFTLALMDESEFTLSDHRGKVVLIDFWATWCPPCVQSLPHLQAMYDELGGDRVEFVGVSLDRPTASNQVLAMMERFGLTYPIGINDDGEIATAYGAASIPTLVVVDQEGVVRHVKVGFSEPAMSQVAELVRELVAVEE